MKISVENLGKRFNREWIFKNLTYEFASGCYAITGPNGSGKSTLLQVLWGQMPQTTGKIIYQDNKDSTIDSEEIFRHLAIATPYMELIEEFTLLEMLNFHFQFKAIKNDHSILDLLEKLELTHAKNKLISNFSSGMKQRVKLGLAFFAKADALFFDEPTTNLDTKAIDWYLMHLEQIAPEALLFIASNEERDYPKNAEKLDILSHKLGYN